MRHILATCLLLAIALPCQAQGQKPNTLTPKEIADGWILLFDGETTFGWKSPPRIGDGHLDLTAGRYLFATIFVSFDLQFEYKFAADFPAKKERAEVGMGFGKEDVGLYLGLPKKKEWTQTKFQVNKGKWSLQLHGGKKSEGTEWHAIDLPFITLGRLDGVRNIKLRPINTKPLFNGKDLAGWKVFPKKKSQFAVVDGTINVKDGPGDLQTLGKYKDFILQLECKSNGKHLNSGVFFRCRDNEYQNGYEAQIRNEFTPKPTQKYAIEEYDPKTNKLLGKKDIMSTAVDYGTGAIYRRQPARKEMSKDGEWFSMTIVAHGNHFATWVNGVQVTDWTDNRPKSDNARTGCRLEGGHISIQGHDPTTNLSFRNIRIAELPN